MRPEKPCPHCGRRIVTEGGHAPECERLKRHPGVELFRLDQCVDGIHETKLIALKARRFVGSVGLAHKNRRSAAMRQLFVEPDARRSGVGRVLCEECFFIAVSSGCETLGLSLAADNAAAAIFYDRLGFIFGYEYEDGSLCLVKMLGDAGSFEDWYRREYEDYLADPAHKRDMQTAWLAASKSGVAA